MPAEPARPPVTLLGPQRDPELDRVLESLDLHGRIALVNAGWREREPDDELLSSLAGGDTVNLRLWHRMQEVWEADPEFAEADQRRRAVLEEMQELYLLGLDHVVGAITALHQHTPRAHAVREQAIADAEEIMQDMDRRHLERVSEVHQRFWQRWKPHERPAVAGAREAVSRELAEAHAVVMTGGHVGILVGALHLFNVAPQIRVPVIAWGAGAMALTDRVVLFHDRAAHGPTATELFSSGVGLVRDVVALPDARSRLDLDNRPRMATLARRFAPATCLVLDRGARVHVTPDGSLPEDAPVLRPDGTIREGAPV
jgi:hypothetical protein